MSKKVPQNNVKPTYEYKEKNIYKAGKSYRIRVAGQSTYRSTLSAARKARTYMKISQKQGPII